MALLVMTLDSPADSFLPFGQGVRVSVLYSPELLQLEAAVDALLATDLRDIPEAHRLGNQEKLLELRNKIDAIELHGLQRLDADETTIAETGRTTKSWLTEEQYLNPGEAGKRTRLGRALAAYPRVDAALSAGQFSADTTLIIVKALATVPPQFLDTVEAALLQLAPHCTPNDLADKVEQLLLACGVESSSDKAAAKRLEKRGLNIAPTFNGMRSVSGMLTPEVGEALEIAIGAIAQSAGEEDDRTHAQRRHDAVGELANFYLAHADLPAVNGERPRVVVTIDYDALVDNLTNAWGQLPSGATVSPATARRLACDAGIIPAVLGKGSEVLDLGKHQRCFSHAVRRAAWIEQHGKCAFKGCRRPPVDCHHIVWWIHGGLSILDNAAWLCAFHHWLVHERGWNIRREKDRSFTFLDPTGVEFPRRSQAA